MWNYQEIITERNVTLVIECGAKCGGSTLFFYCILKTLNRPFKILSIDIENKWSNTLNFLPQLIKLCASDVSPMAIHLMKKMIAETSGTVFVILDSSHKEKHVKTELETITPLLRVGDYIVIEDTASNVGTMNAVVNFMKDNNQYIFDSKRESKFGVTQAKRGFYIRA